ncbi:hypothetical protein AA0472_2132 [Acetobacter estunensis NRIC 0472]|uniref:hypothetical protein n=1 Tax=Acetobacter estunensis TaxID=104097 RepID=UPI001F549F2C|nr:hypothetical protein [Acetobacter estunensis]GBQ26500.1 hypothetical protein AA0472_2132 [Acetobacter estunensis NRIC 0472]
MDGDFSLFTGGQGGRKAVRNPFEGAFGTRPVPARPLDRGMGEAVGRRTVFRPSDREDFGRVADRVAEGNAGLLATVEDAEIMQLRNAIARLRTHSQKMTVAARQMAEKKTVGHLS